MLEGTIIPVHASVIWKGVINEGAKWFTVDYNKAAGILNDVYTNYSNYVKRAKGTINFTKSNFGMDKMTEKFKVLLDDVLTNIPTQQTLKLPQLKKLDNKQEPVKLSLPKLKKVTS